MLDIAIFAILAVLWVIAICISAGIVSLTIISIVDSWRKDKKSKSTNFIKKGD